MVTTNSGEWRFMLDEIATNIGALTNWSEVERDQPTTGELTSGDRVVYDMPTGEQLEFEIGTHDGIRYHFGTNWDSSDNSFGTRYASYPRGNDDGYAPITNDPMNGDDAVTYWFTADGESFCFYVQREAGDNDNRDIANGLARVTEAWDLSTASASFSEWAFLGAGGLADFGGYEFANNYNPWDTTPPDPDFNGWVVGNPDANFTDAPAATPNIVTRDELAVENNDTIIGTHDLWYENKGGLAHKDTVDIAGVAYTVYAAEDTWILMKD